MELVSPEDASQIANFTRVDLFNPRRVGLALGRKQAWTVSWALRNDSGAHHPLSPVIKLTICHPTSLES